MATLESNQELARELRRWWEATAAARAREPDLFRPLGQAILASQRAPIGDPAARERLLLEASTLAVRLLPRIRPDLPRAAQEIAVQSARRLVNAGASLPARLGFSLPSPGVMLAAIVAAWWLWK